MKKTGRFIAFVLCFAFILSFAQDAFAASGNLRAESFSSRDGDARIEVSNIEDVTYYLEVGNERNISIAVYPNETIEYVVFDKNNSEAYYTATAEVSDMSAYKKSDFNAGRFDMSSKAIDEFSSIKAYFDNIELEKVSIAPFEVIVESVTPSTDNTKNADAFAPGEIALLALDYDQTRALDAAKELNGQPFGPQWLGFSTRDGVRADLDHFMSYANPVHTNTLLNAALVTLAILAGLWGIGTLTLIKVITTVVISGIRYVQQGVSLKRYDVVAMETKLATIGGSTWYWAGKDTVVKVAVGNEGATGYDRVPSWTHTDFYNHTYLLQKALDNYFGIW